MMASFGVYLPSRKKSVQQSCGLAYQDRDGWMVFVFQTHGASVLGRTHQPYFDQAGQPSGASRDPLVKSPYRAALPQPPEQPDTDSSGNLLENRRAGSTRRLDAVYHIR